MHNFFFKKYHFIDKFEAEEEMDDMEDVEADEDMSEEADLEENSTTDAKFQKTGMAQCQKVQQAQM